MPVIAIANPKAGVGKRTLATELAGWQATTAHAAIGESAWVGAGVTT